MFGPTFEPGVNPVQRFSFAAYGAINPVTVNQSPFSGTLARRILLLQWSQFTNVQTPNNTTNFWIINLAYNNGTVFASFNTSGDVVAGDTLHTILTFNNMPADPAVNPSIVVTATKSGAPGNLFIFHPWLEFVFA